MKPIDSTSFEKLESNEVPQEGIFYEARQLFGSDIMDQFVEISSNDNIPPKQGPISNIIDTNASKDYESGKSKDCSVLFYFPHHKIKITKYLLTAKHKMDNLAVFSDWSIDGSNDNINWINIDNQKEPTDFETIVSSQMFDSKNQDFFKIIKLSSPNKIAISSIEFFGYAETDNKQVQISENIAMEKDHNSISDNSDKSKDAGKEKDKEKDDNDEKARENDDVKIDSSKIKKTNVPKLNRGASKVELGINEIQNPETIYKNCVDLQKIDPTLKNNNNCSWTDEKINIPKISPKLEATMKMGISVSYDKNFYKGIFDIVKSRFYTTPVKAGFIQIFADTKKNKEGTEEYLVDCNKETEWYSTNKKFPSITLFFPYHIVRIESIGFRSHNSHGFGMHFLKKFLIEGLNDNQNWIYLGSFIDCRFGCYEAKAIIDIKRENLRAIRIRSANGKFGLSYIELFGQCQFMPLTVPFSKKILTDTTQSFLRKPGAFETKLTQFNDTEAKKSMTHKFISTIKNAVKNTSQNNVKEWSDHSDDDSSDEKFEIKMDDPNGPGLVEAYEGITGHPIALCNSPKSNLLTYKFKYEPNDNDYFRFDFKALQIHPVGIKIKTCQSASFSPHKGIIVGGITVENEQEDEEWELICFTSAKELEPSTEYFIPIPSTNKIYCSFMITSPEKFFELSHVEFYGDAKLGIPRNPSEIPKQDNYFPLFFHRPIPTVLADDINGPSLFEKMKEYYGPILNGFVQFFVQEPERMYFYNKYFNIQSKHEKNPSIALLFNQHKILPTCIKITFSKNANEVPDHIIISDTNIVIADIARKFKPGEEVEIPIEFSSKTDIIYIHSVFCPLDLSHIELYGEANPRKKFCTEIDESFNFNSDLISYHLEELQKNKCIEEHKKEILLSYEENPKILFSANNTSCSGIFEYGFKNFKKFASFFNYGDNGSSILLGNPDNLWLTTESNGKNEFHIYFPSHSVRLKSFVIATVKDPRYEKYTPKSFVLFGFSTKAKRWDVLFTYDSEKNLDFMSRYSFKIKNETKNNFYKVIYFLTLSGRVSFAYIDLYGDVKEDKEQLSNDLLRNSRPEVNFVNMPFINAKSAKKFTPGIFTKAMQIFGPTLINFVEVYCSCDKDSYDYDIWEARNERFKSRQERNIITITFYFPNHEVILEGYYIKPDIYPGLDYWAIVGYETNCSRGTILAHKARENFDDDDNYYTFKLDKTYTAYRTIRFFGLNQRFSFKCLDFYGVAQPARKIADHDPKYYIPEKVKKWYVGD